MYTFYLKNVNIYKTVTKFVKVVGTLLAEKNGKRKQDCGQRSISGKLNWQ